MRSKAAADTRPRPPFPIALFAQLVSDLAHRPVHSDVKVWIRFVRYDIAERNKIRGYLAPPQWLPTPIVRLGQPHCYHAYLIAE